MRTFSLLTVMLLAAVQSAWATVEATWTGTALTLKVTGTVTSAELSGYSAATSLSIVTDGYGLTSTDLETILFNSGSAPFPNVTTLDLSGVEKLAPNATDGEGKVTYALGGLKVLNYSGSSPITKITMPYSGELPAAFNANTTLQEVVFPDKDAAHADAEFKLVETQTFNACTSLRRVTIGTSVKQLFGSAFMGCTSLSYLDIHEGQLTEIPASCFQGCTSLKSINIPEGIKTIRGYAFYQCSACESISLPNSLTTIGVEGTEDANTFGYMSALTAITIPDKVGYIAPNTFQNSAKLHDIYILGDNVKASKDTFDPNMVYASSSYDASRNEGDVYEDWHNSDNTPMVVLHVPDNATAHSHYINPYLLALNSITDEQWAKWKSLTVYQDQYDFCEALKKSIKWPKSDENWYNIAQLLDNASGSNYAWTEVDGFKFFHKDGGMFAMGDSESWMTDAYAGWKSIMLVNGSADDQPYDDQRILESRWYTAVWPFDMTYKQVMDAYGANTEVCEFEGVLKPGDDSYNYTLYFTDNLETPTTQEAREKDVYVKAHHPYMIHPGVRKEAIKDEGGNITAGRSIAGVSQTVADKAIADAITNNTLANNKVTKPYLTKDGDGKISEASGDTNFEFYGTYEDQNFDKGIYFYGFKADDIAGTLGYYYTTSAQTNNQKGWKAFTCIVKPTNASYVGSKFMNIEFAKGMTIEDEEITGIELPQASNTAEQQHKSENGAIYNLQGLKMNATELSQLPKGIYVMNGRKYIVK